MFNVKNIILNKRSFFLKYSGFQKSQTLLVKIETFDLIKKILTRVKILLVNFK